MSETLQQKTHRLLDQAGREVSDKWPPLMPLEEIEDDQIFRAMCDVVALALKEERENIAYYLDSRISDDTAGFEIADAIRRGVHNE